MTSMTDVVAFARDLIRCPSITPNEGGALTTLQKALTAAGFVCERVTFSEPGTPDVDNLYARFGTGKPYLLFAGHTDVVPAGDESRWTHGPFAGDVKDGALYGRGAVDMKGGVAAFAAAAIDYLADNKDFAGSIGFLITGDEEGPAINGTVKLLKWAHEKGERFDHCILGEPTNPKALSDMIKIGRRGSLTGKIIVNGKQGHVGYPYLADNPIRGLTKLLVALQDKPIDDGTKHFEPSNLEFSTVDVGNPSSNVIPAEARATFNIRFNDRWTHETLEAEIRKRCEKAAGNSVNFTLTVAPSNAPAFLTKPGPFVNIVADAIEAETGQRPTLSTTGGTSDARFIKDYCEVLEYGLVGDTMHQIDERVMIVDLEGLMRIYRRVIASYFSPQG
ncbi:succinyl-diaminopimelate desuccinylase [Terrarubrum flagellatum]|uniref:succinyl-diaminopimelate desuccinylase n=1 Tax=Terrirubrum flagellatum TaxID=2895980 RepID=UPI0031450F26